MRYNTTQGENRDRAGTFSRCLRQFCARIECKLSALTATGIPSCAEPSGYADGLEAEPFRRSRAHDGTIARHPPDRRAVSIVVQRCLDKWPRDNGRVRDFVQE